MTVLARVALLAALLSSISAHAAAGGPLPVPEPGSLALVALGGVAAWWVKRHGRRK